MTPQGAVLGDPCSTRTRSGRCAMALTEWTICNGAVAAAVQAAMEDGYRVFTETVAPPLLPPSNGAGPKNTPTHVGRRPAGMRQSSSPARLADGAAPRGRRFGLLALYPLEAAGGCAAARGAALIHHDDDGQNSRHKVPAPSRVCIQALGCMCG